MKEIVTRWSAPFFTGTIIALVVIGVGIFVLRGDSATADLNDWPPLTMTYVVDVPVNVPNIRQVRRLTYTSKTSWVEEVIQADDIVLSVGTFNHTGSYQKLDGNEYTEYDVTTGETQTETIPEDTIRIPRSGFTPIPISVLEEALDKEVVRVPTTTRVCFNDVCEDNAPGWKLQKNRSVTVFADDARGIPVWIANIMIVEVRVHDERVPLR